MRPTARTRAWAPLLSLVLVFALPAFAWSSGAETASDRLTGVATVSAGGEHGCAVRQDGSLWCWGRNTYGRLGLGFGGKEPQPPTQVGRNKRWASVSAGGASTCAVKTNGALFCWGLNHRGQLGDKTRKIRRQPTRVRATRSWSQVAVGWFHTCATRTNGALWCWGDNSAGQLGRGHKRQSLSRVRVPGRYVDVATGGWHTCGVRRSGTMWCWGRNLFGQLGDGSYRDRSRPTRVGNARNWEQVAVSWTHTCGMNEGGRVRCWGRNNQGQLGNGRTTRSSNRPRLVTGGHRAASIDVAEGTSCLVDRSAHLWCWGDDRYRQTGGRGRRSTTPVRRPGSYTSVSGGWMHVCAATGRASVCWGNNEWGQLGNGDPAVRPVPRTYQAPRGRRKSSPYRFRLATYNVLGNGHSRPYAHDDRFGPSRMRAEWTAQALITGGIDVVGIQEPTAGQVAAILTAAHGRYEAYPGPERGDLGVETTILWDTRRFEATRRRVIRTQFIARVLPRPIVRLRDKRTGRQFWVMNVHNAPWDYQRRRNQATRKQLAKIKDLERTRLPVFYIGDMNEKRTILCKTLRRTGLDSPIGGRIARNGRCIKPRQRMRVDWIFGSEFVEWSRFRHSRPPLVRLSTDHWVPVVDVRVP